jgi:DNA-binding LacI/PurR family transcriptional regulator/GAF domain-containing protein
VADNHTNSRPTIGFLLVNTLGIGKYYFDLWTGVVDALEAQGADVLCFAGGTLGIAPLQNAVFGLASAEGLDGVIIDNTIGNQIPHEEFDEFLGRFSSLPMVSLGLVREDIPSVQIDNEKGLRDVLVHLIEAHTYRRIAFIRGPESSADAEERYRIYKEVLAEYHVPFDPALVAGGDFRPEAGEAAVRLLLDERKVAFDAIMAANDNMAIGALEALRARDVRVPHEVAVAGFDDVETAAAFAPSLTTVRQPTYEQGKMAGEMMMALLAGESVSPQVTLPTELVVRRSCGCTLPAVSRARASISSPSPMPDKALTERREQILSSIVQEIGTRAVRITSKQAGHLLDAFTVDLGQAGTREFLSVLEDELSQAATRGEMVAWQETLSVMRRHVLPYLSDKALPGAENLWHQARVFVGDFIQRAEMYRALQSDQWNALLREIGHALNATADLQELAGALAEQLPRLEIPSGYIALYDEGEVYPTRTEPTERSTLVLAYDASGRIELEPKGREFLSRQLLPDGMLHREDRSTMLVEPLYVSKGPLGFLVIEMGLRDGAVYRSLGEQISSALQAIKLVQQVEERSRALQEANYALQRRAIQIEASAEVGRAITSIFDIDDLFQQTATLIGDRFGFYHVGIFLLDATGEWAILREATGEAGAQMKAEGHRLAVGDTSMVGWTAAHRQPRIALDVGEDAVRFAHPLLPHTRSEMTLPLAVGDQLLGVLNVQSTEEAAFDQDDVRALQSMADQVAIAIQNVQRFSDETALLESTSPVYRTSRLLTTATTRTEVADAIIASVGETGADGCLVVEFEFSPAGEPEALLYLGVWRRDREPQFQAGLRLPVAESPFPLEMVSTLWTVPDVDLDDRLPRSARVVFQATGARALVNIPLHSGERVIGQVVVIRATPGPFTEAALRLYEVLSDQAAVALERAELLEEAQRRATREQQARQMVDRIRQAVDLEQALGIAAEELSQAMQVPHVSIDLGVDAIKQE